MIRRCFWRAGIQSSVISGRPDNQDLAGIQNFGPRPARPRSATCRLDL